MTDKKCLLPGISFDVLQRAYGWTIDVDGQLLGLVAGDMGYEPTGIFIPKDHLTAFMNLPFQPEAWRVDHDPPSTSYAEFFADEGLARKFHAHGKFQKPIVSLYSMPRVPAVYRICEHCNTEYKTPIGVGGSTIYNFGDCPHCGKRDDAWIAVRYE